MTVSEPKHEPWCASVERPFDAVMRRGPYPCDCKRAEPSRGAPDAAHTPGPWHVEGNGIYRADGGRVAILHGRMDSREEPDARLIAQAPTLLAENEKLRAGHMVLLEACKAAKREMLGLAAYMETCEPSVIVDNLPSLAKALNLKVDAIEAAIQKVEGR